MSRSMNIFVQYASDCLTDHLPHGEGLLCHDWIKALALRGHRLFVFTEKNEVRQPIPNTTIKEASKYHGLPSWKYWSYSKQSAAWLSAIQQDSAIDLVWRLYPYRNSAPYIFTAGLPLAIGPLYSAYEQDPPVQKPAFGWKPSEMSVYFSHSGWKRAIEASNLLFTESKNLAAQLSAIYPKKYITTLPVIVHPTLEVTARELSPAGKPLRLAFVGSFHPSKRLPDFVRLVARLNEAGRDTHGYIMGKGQDEGVARQLVEELQVGQRIHFEGVLPNSEVYQQVASMDFLVTLRPEPYGRNIVEAMSVGTPPICVNRLGPASYLKDGETGFLLDDTSVEAYSKLILNVGQRPDLWKQVSEQARQHTLQWRESIIGEQLETHFHKIITAKGHLPATPLAITPSIS